MQKATVVTGLAMLGLVWGPVSASGGDEDGSTSSSASPILETDTLPEQEGTYQGGPR